MEPRTPAILIVDDDADIRAMLTDLFRLEGYDVATAPDGAVALELLQTTPVRFGLVLLDLQMPHVDGYVFRERQKADPTIADVPVVTLSASAVLRERGLPPGITSDRFVSKPADLEALLALVRHFCGPAPGRA